MIVDLVRNDLGRVCEFGSVEVPALLALEHHPGLVHLVSTVTGRLRPGKGWADAVAATFPPGSVTGAPEAGRARPHPPARAGSPGRVLRRGGLGRRRPRAAGSSTWPSARSGWRTDRLHLGTGGGITWDSDPGDEWAETELKARRLLHVASGAWDGR